MTAPAADAARNASIREWARDNGFTVADAGRLPVGILAAYEAAHASDDDGSDPGGPDWGAAAAVLGVDPLADDDTPDMGGADGAGLPADRAPAAAPAQPPVTQAPPVTSLAEARERLNAQPKRPPWAAREPKAAAAGRADGKTGSRSRGKAPAPPPGPAPIAVTPAVLNDMAGKLALLATPGLILWAQLDDDDCADIAADHMDNIITRMVPILARSQAVVRFMTLDTGWFALVALVQAVQPVAVAVYKNHLTREAREARSPQAREARAQQQAQQDLSDYVVNPVVRGHVPAYRPA